MSLYGRLMGVEGETKIAVHLFQSLMGEVARGRITGAQARALVEADSGESLTTAEAAEASALLATIAGSTTAKLARAKEIDDVLLLAERRAAGYETPAAVALRLGV